MRRSILLLMALWCPLAHATIRVYQWRVLDSSADPTARVPRFYVTSTLAELTGSVGGQPGDTGYVLANGLVYFYTGSSWMPVADAPVTSKYLLQQPDAFLPNAQSMSALATGLVLNATTTGVQSIYAGSTCGAGTKATATNASGALTCSAVSLTADVSGDLPYANLAQAGAASRLLGRGSAGGAGDWQEITLGANLSMSGTTINASGGGSTPTGTGYNHVTAGVQDGAAKLVNLTAATDTAANQGTTSTVLHGNAAGQASFGSVVLGTDTSGNLPAASVTPPTGTGYWHITTGATDAASDLVTLTAASDVAANQGTVTTLLHGNAAGQASFGSVVSADMNITTTSCSNQFVTALSAGGVGTCTTDTLASAQHANQGTTATVLHGNAAGNPAFGAVVSADLNITSSTCTNQFLTAISSGAAGTCTTDTLASAQHANQGTTTTVLHGNAAGNPSFAAVSLSADVTGSLSAASVTPPTGTGFWHITAGATDAASKTVNLTAASDVAANQGTTVTVFHGNAAGQGSFGSVVDADITAMATTKLTGTITDAQLANNYSGIGTCTNQFARVLNDNAAPTCSSVGSADITDGTVAYADIQNLGALAVMGRSANSSGVGADIAATATSGAVLRESGSTIGFGSITEGAVTNLTTDLAGKVPTTRNVNTTAPVTGGGDLSADRTIAVSDFVASGVGHARGTVPDPGASAGTTRFLREDATFAVPAGGGGSANVATVDLDFGSAGNTSATTVVTGQAWVTGTSRIICAPTAFSTSTRAEGADDASIEGLVVTPYSRVVGTGFTVKGSIQRGEAFGVFTVNCVGS